MPILPELHDLPHPVEPDLAWSESWYFNAYSPGSQTGFVTRIGVRPNAGSAHALLVVWLPDGTIAQTELEAEVSSITDGPVSLGPLRYDRLEPLRTWRVRVDETLLGGRRISIDATFTALAPAIGIDRAGAATSSDAARTASRRSLAAGHFEQSGSWAGALTVEGRSHELRGFGNRDKSWGPRETSGDRGLRMWRWFSINLGASFHLGGIVAGTEAGELHRGWVFEDGHVRTIKRWQLTTRLADDGLAQRSIVLDATDSSGTTHSIRGEVLRVAEIGIGEARGMRIFEALTRFECGAHGGHGIAEYAHLIDPGTGKPVVPIV